MAGVPSNVGHVPVRPVFLFGTKTIRRILVSMSIAGVPSDVGHLPYQVFLVMFGTYTMRSILVPGTHPVKGTY